MSALALGLVAPGLARAAEAVGSDGDDPARRIVARADEIRFPRESFVTDITVTNFSDGEPGEQRKFRILSRGTENTIVLTLEPASERGQALLMRGRDLWVFIPSVSQPVRLSLSQRLTGQVANGDLARANFAGDYNPTLVGTETLASESAHVLDLAAADRGVTYARVKYWVAEKNGRPLQAEFYALSGRLLKTARYEDFREIGGRVRPTRLVMEDALKKGEVSVLKYEDMTLRDLPERMFTREYLRRLE
jgi:outer membrane lipoprotein-sorting protein